YRVTVGLLPPPVLGLFLLQAEATKSNTATAATTRSICFRCNRRLLSPTAPLRVRPITKRLARKTSPHPEGDQLGIYLGCTKDRRPGGCLRGASPAASSRGSS